MALLSLLLLLLLSLLLLLFLSLLSLLSLLLLSLLFLFHTAAQTVTLPRDAHLKPRQQQAISKRPEAAGQEEAADGGHR